MNHYVTESDSERLIPLVVVVMPSFVGALIWLWAILALVRQ